MLPAVKNSGGYRVHALFVKGLGGENFSEGRDVVNDYEVELWASSVLVIPLYITGGFHLLSTSHFRSFTKWREL